MFVATITIVIHHLLLIISNVIVHHDNDLLIWNSISVYNLVCMAHICLKLSKFSLLALTEILPLRPEEKKLFGPKSRLLSKRKCIPT